MAKKLAECKKEFAAIKKSVASATEKINSNTQMIGQTMGVVQEGTKEIGLQIQKLKDGGATGKTLKDFLRDGEVKQMWDSIQDYMKQIEKEQTKITSLHKGDFTKTKNKFWDFKKDLKDEISKRKKKKGKLISVDSKSLPDLEKLLKDVDAYTDREFARLDVFEPEAFSDLKKELDRWINSELTSTKEAKLSKFQQEMNLQALNTRNLKKHVGNAKKLFEEVVKHCKQAQSALENRQQKELMTAKANIPKPLKELTDLAKRFDDAAKDQWIKGQIKGSKDKTTIEKGIEAMSTMAKKAREEVATVANATID